MRLNITHKNMIYAAVMVPFAEDVAKACRELADKINNTDFVHKMFGHEKIDVSESLQTLKNYHGIDLNNAHICNQEVCLGIGRLLHDIIYRNPYTHDYGYVTNSLPRGDFPTLVTSEKRSAYHTGVVHKDWVEKLKDSHNFTSTIESDPDIPDELKANITDAKYSGYSFEGRLNIPCVPALWDKTGARAEAAQVLKAIHTLRTMHNTMCSILQATTYKKLIDTMPQLKSIIPAEIHAAAEDEKQRREEERKARKNKAPAAPVEPPSFSAAAQALTIKRLQGQL